MGDVSEKYKQALARSSFGTDEVREAVAEMSDEQRDRLKEKLRQAKERLGE